MMEPVFVIAAATLVGLSVVAYALLKAWHDWLEFKRQELERPAHAHAHASAAPEIEGGAGVGAARIEMADLKERIKKLEAIASGVEF